MNWRARLYPAMLLPVALVFAATVGAATITVDPQTRHQTIDGFGGFGGVVAEYASEAQYTDAWVDLVVRDLGLSIHRYFLNPVDLEPTNDNTNPLVTDLTKYNTAGRLGGQIPLLSRLKNAGVDKFFFSILSPPYWMKQGPYNEWCYGGGDCSCCGGNLRTDMYSEFAEFCAAYVRLAKQQAGVDLYALSVQNEPRFSEPYPACVYSANTFRDMVKAVGARLQSEGLGATRLMIAEDLLNSFGTLEGAVMSDSAARKYVGVFGTHTYSDGVNPTQTSEAARLWSAAQRKVSATGLGLWMTETSGYENSWNGAFTLALGIYAALQYGKASGWVYYRLGGSSDGLTENGQPTWLYYSSKQYYRYVRPGAVRIEARSDDSAVLAQVFVHPADSTATVVLFNQSQSAVSVTLNAIPQARFTVYRSSATQRCVDAGAFSGSSLSLPARSITTLYGTGYVPPAGVETRPSTRQPGRATRDAHPRSVHSYDLRGRAAPAGASVRISPMVGSNPRLRVAGIK